MSGLKVQLVGLLLSLSFVVVLAQPRTDFYQANGQPFFNVPVDKKGFEYSGTVLPPGMKKTVEWFTAEGPAHLRAEGIPNIAPEKKQKIHYAELYYPSYLENDDLIEFISSEAGVYHGLYLRNVNDRLVLTFYSKDDEELESVDIQRFTRRQMHLLLLSRGLMSKDEWRQLKANKKNASKRKARSPDN